MSLDHDFEASPEPTQDSSADRAFASEARASEQVNEECPRVIPTSRLEVGPN